MYKLLLSILFATMFSGSLAATGQKAQPDQDWERFRVVKEGFSVLFPEWPAVVSRGQYRSAMLRGSNT
jgi:hypothetical protein